MSRQIFEHLAFLYGVEQAEPVFTQLENLLDSFASQHPEWSSSKRTPRFSERDSVLITYGDMVQEPEKAPLNSLAEFLQAMVADVISTVHILPFYPYSSDDGFSVIDYAQVDPKLGTWADVAQISRTFRMMFDAVVNHISAESDWFQAFLRDEAPYRDYFVTVSPDEDLTAVFRPRALPLLTEVETGTGPKHVWTTFSDDQIDLNFANPDTLLDVIKTLLLYIEEGAEFIRLDAIAYIWKEIGTSCIHLPQTHAIIQIMRAALDTVAPQVAIITETNVPHKDNISYFGNGYNEAQMVYNFSLPPLILHTFHSGDATHLSEWAATLELPSDQVTFFNFCASHDGIGLTPARGILSEQEIEAIATRVQALGGFVSYKANSDGSQAPYELNINYLNALGIPNAVESDDWIAARFLASQAIMLSLRGVPGIYFHSLFGSQNWPEGVLKTGRNRTINRQKLQRDDLEQELKQGLRQQVFSGYCALLKIRAAEKAFHPIGQQTIHDLHPSLFIVSRTHEDETIFCVHNVSAQSVAIALPTAGMELLTETAVSHQMTLAPYQVAWIKSS